LLYQINPRAWLTGLSRALGRRATLDDVPGAELARLRARLQRRGLRLMLDFGPNHMAPDHAWVDEHPDRFVHGSEIDLARAPRRAGGRPLAAGP
jgi:glycosidase